MRMVWSITFGQSSASSRSSGASFAHPSNTPNSEFGFEGYDLGFQVVSLAGGGEQGFCKALSDSLGSLGPPTSPFDKVGVAPSRIPTLITAPTPWSSARSTLLATRLCGVKYKTDTLGSFCCTRRSDGLLSGQSFSSQKPLAGSSPGRGIVASPLSSLQAGKLQMQRWPGMV